MFLPMNRLSVRALSFAVSLVWLAVIIANAESPHSSGVILHEESSCGDQGEQPQEIALENAELECPLDVANITSGGAFAPLQVTELVWAQSFVPSCYRICAVALQLARDTDYPSVLRVAIHEDAGGHPGDYLASGGLVVTTLPETMEWVYVEIAELPEVNPGESYFIVLRLQFDLPGDDLVKWFAADGNPYPSGKLCKSLNSGLTWLDEPGYDAGFAIYGAVPPDPPGSFNATWPTSSTVNLFWDLGAGSDETVICRSTSDYPNSPTSGDLVYAGSGVEYLDTGLEPDTRYYYSAWGYNSESELYSLEYVFDSSQTLPEDHTITFYTTPSYTGSMQFDSETFTHNQTTTREAGSYSLSANVPGGLEFDHWTTTGDVQVSSSTSSSTTATVDGDGSIRAVFEESSCTLTFYTSPSSSGSITFDGSSYVHGQSTNCASGSYDLSASGYGSNSFTHWSTIGDVSVENPNSSSTTLHVSGDGSITAHFDLQEENVITYYAHPSDGGDMTFDGIALSHGGQIQRPDGSYSAAAQPATTSYSFDHWSTAGGVSVADPYARSTTATVSSSGSIEAHYEFNPPEAEWTILVYLAADNNLEPFGWGDLNEMEVAGSSDDVNIIVLFDGFGPANTTLYKVDRDPGGLNATVISTVLDDGGAIIPSSGEVNMGDPETLTDFVTWVHANYPANNANLILWNHGSGWRGSDVDLIKAVCFDEESGHDALEMSELREALDLLTSSGSNPVELIGFDACVMQMIEVGYEIHEYADYMTASEAGEPGDGWNYDETLAVLVGTPTLSPEALGAQFVSDYMAEHGWTLSTADLSLYDSLRLLVSNLGDALQDEDFREAIEVAFANVEHYNDALSFADLFQLCELLEEEIDDEAIDQLAQHVRTEIENVLTSSNHNSSFPHAHGLSIYAPQVGYDQEYSDLRFAEHSQWDEFLDWFDRGPANTPPNAPSDPVPANTAMEVPLDQILAWTGGDADEDTVYYDVYLEADDATPDLLVSENQLETFFDPELLTRNATYYWKIVAEDEHGAITVGPVWQFTTVTDAAFVRGDTDGNGEVNISDPIESLCYQFASCESPSCMDAADCDDSGEINISDPIFSLAYQFGSGPAFPPPYPNVGPDPTGDDPLDCESYAPDRGGDSALESVSLQNPSADGQILLRTWMSAGGDTLNVDLHLESARDLVGIECHFELDPHRLWLVGLATEGFTGEDFDFLSCALSTDEDRIHLGGIPDIGLAEPLPAGQYLLGRLRFILMDDPSVAPASIRLQSCLLVDADLEMIHVTGGAALDTGGSELTTANLIRRSDLALRIPCPFQPPDDLRLSLPETQEVRIEIHDIQGRLVRTLAHGSLSAGEHRISWDGTSSRGTHLSSGIFYARLQTANGAIHRRIMLAR